MNGLSQEAVIEETVFWWQPALIVACSVLGIMCLASLAVFLWRAYVKKGGN